ncbi:AMP-binding protein [Arthrobacter sp. P2b]|uniref:AMP-binding protein n=1 Tax=Arthrobacter sp. P2b TaxID=1938741 RepID=UPI0009A7FD4B|nr:AMP-binding protein [Arthrobacter sp. P2b]SLK03938.1 Acyl-CoA synthetase (AMP-forming)/AMP-acid ligase II [Arthrobacter sp. P2b]
MTAQPDLARAAFTDLARHGDRPAVLSADGVLSYRELASRVDDAAARLGTARRLVVLAAQNDLDSLVAYLAALSAGHVLLLAPADKPEALASLMHAYDPDVLLRSGDGHGVPVLEERRNGSRHHLHPELALLLSTSGSTGSPKLVRLSHTNLTANAEAIAEYLGIGADDRAATTLPLHYCYGLSVVNSHLIRGAGLVLTDLSVVDPCFWDLFRDRQATSFAAVPYTFDLLDRVGFADADLPHLRYVTQAGGRLAPEKVRAWAETGQRRGWDLYVMYGATEATARMAYLPPDLAADHAETIGVPVPGGSFRIDPVEDLADGELVYSGPNVMLGYAEHPSDLALGREVHELRTGDLARRQPNGLYEVVGRRSRFVKIVGLRVDLGQVERILADMGITAAAAGTDDRLVIAVEGGHDGGILAKTLAGTLGLPRAAVVIHAVEALPRLATGKVDYPGVLALAAPEPAAAGAAGATSAAVADDAATGTAAPAGPPPAGRADDIRIIFAEALECPVVGDDDTFVSLDGDSLSYVAVSVQLERVLGQLPADWHLLPVRELERRRKPRRRSPFSFLETSIVLRAVAIVCIVATHVELIMFQTAHLLFAVAGYNFARFQLADQRVTRLRRQLRGVARIVVPSTAFIAVAYLLTDHYTVANIFLLNAMVGPEAVTTQWHFWFVELLVYILLAVAALMAVPWVDRLERRAPFAFALGLVAIALLSRYDIVDPGLPKPPPVFWIFALGWALARARTHLHRITVSAITLVTLPGFFGSSVRDVTVAAGILLLVWVPALPVPAFLRRVIGWLAAASLYIYLTHWLVYPLLLPVNPVLAVVGSLVLGVGYWALCRWLPAAAGRLWARRFSSTARPRQAAGAPQAPR